MATDLKNTEPTNAETATKVTSVLRDDCLHEDDDASTIGDDNELEANMNTPTIDKTNLSCGHFLIDNHDSSTVLEGWEIISVRPTNELASSKRIFGVNVVSTYKVMKDGYTGVRAIPSYSQLELAHAVATAEREWAAQKSSRLMGRNTYSQDLARRIFELPACLPSKLGALLDCRFVATNKNPHVRREWKIIMLKPVLEVLTDEGQPLRNLGIWKKGGGRQSTPVQKWLVILRGQDTRWTNDCTTAGNMSQSNTGDRESGSKPDGTWYSTEVIHIKAAMCLTLGGLEIALFSGRADIYAVFRLSTVGSRPEWEATRVEWM